MPFAKPKTAKNELIAFLRQVQKTKTHEYIVELPLMTDKDAKDFVHRMRVELSRFRTTIQLQSKQVRPFKMLLQEIIHSSDKTNITLLYRDTVDDKTLKDVDEIFSIISTGSNMINEKDARDLPSKPLHFG